MSIQVESMGTDKILIFNFELESQLFDFIIIDGEPLPVKWEEYLIKVYIKKAENGFDGCQVEGIYKDCKFKMKYIGNLKQNYAQRIANRAYSFANRIGITYISKDIDRDKQKKEEKEGKAIHKILKTKTTLTWKQLNSSFGGKRGTKNYSKIQPERDYWASSIL